VLAAAYLAAGSARAADPAPSAAAPAEPAYRVVIDAPPSLKAAVERSVGLVRWQTYGDMTVELMERLARDAQDEARGAADAAGYFSARIDIAILKLRTPSSVRRTG